MPTTAQLRAALYRRPGFTRASGRTGVLVNGVYSGVASSSDAQRTLLSTDLVSLDLVGTGSDVRRDWWTSAWTYVPSVPVQRRVPHRGYMPAEIASTVSTSSSSDYLGYFTVDRPFDSVLSANLAYEVLSPLPWLPDSATGVKGMLEFTNRALHQLNEVKRIAITGVSGTELYDLAAYEAWIRSGDQLVAVYDRADSAAREPLMTGGPDPYLRFDGEGTYLVVPGGMRSGTFYAEFRRPLDSWIGTGGPTVWADSTVGLVNETDVSAGDLQTIAELAAYYAYDYLAERPVMGTATMWEERRDRAARAVGKYIFEEQVSLISFPSGAGGSPNGRTWTGDSLAYGSRYGRGGRGWP